MQEIFHQILGYLREMWLRKWIGLAVAWIVAMVGVAVVFRIPDQYEANARVFVDTQSLLKPLLAGLAIQPNVDQQVAMMSRTLISRPNVERVVRTADLDLQAQTQAEREALIESVFQNLRLTGNTTSNLYNISFRDNSPEKARSVVQALLTIFVESSLGDKRQDSKAAVQFLDDQIKRYEEALKEAERKLEDFKLRNLGVADRDGGYAARIAQVKNQLELAHLELAGAEQTRDSYRKELAGEQPVFLSDTTTPPPQGPTEVPQIDTRLATQRQLLDELLRKYTDQHPDVVATNRRIKQLEEEKQAELEARRAAASKHSAGGTGAPLSTDRNPVFQQLRMALAEAEAQVARARAKVVSYEAQNKQLLAQAQRIPAIQTEFVQLNRDYDVQKRTYDSLIARRESAGLGIDVQDRSGAQFRVIEPPRVSPRPVSPNRLGLIGMVFLLAIGAGFAASFIASQLKPTFADARVLREVTQRPVLGMVEMVASPSSVRSRRRGNAMFAGGLSALLASFAALAAFALLVTRAA